MAASAPEEFNTLFLTRQTIVVNTEEARELHRELIARFHEAMAAQ